MLEDKRKPSFDAQRTILGKIYPLSSPFNVIVDASEVCNFRCGYCFRGQEDREKWGYARKAVFMEWDLFTRAVSQMEAFPEPVRQISLSNHGEPLCNRRVPDMVRYIKRRGIKSRVSIHTNAAMLDEDYSRDLADSDIDRIVVSLQGLSARKYKEVCGADIDFDRFYHNLTVLFENKKNTQIYFKIMDVALESGEEEKFYEMFAPIGDRVYVEKIVPIWKEVDLEVLRENTARESQTESAIYNKYGEGFPKQECCPLIFHTIVVSPPGDVYPCTQLLTPYVLGNIRRNTLAELWECEERKELLIRQCKGNNPEICRDCFILQNSIYAPEDMIDDYRDEILERIGSVKKDDGC